MPWQQVAPDRYEREFDTLERFYRGIAASSAHLQKEQYLISSAVRLKSAPSVSELQRAWKALRHQHPQIVTLPDETGSRLTYTVPSQESLKAWMQETLIVHQNGGTADSLNASLPANPLFVLYYFPSSRELLFRTPHWRTDGIGLVLVQHAFFSILADGPPSSELVFDGSELARFPPNLDEAAAIPLEITPAMREASDAELAVLVAGPPPISITATLPNLRPSKSQRVGICLPQSLSEQIITASKARSMTVTTAAQAALVVATRPHAQPLPGRFVCFNTYNIRKYMPPPWHRAPGAVSVYHTGKPCSIDLGAHQDFDAIAGFLTSHYRRDLRPLFAIMADYVSKIGAMLALPLELAIQAPGAAHPELSSLGVIDEYLQSRYIGSGATVEIEDWWLGVEVVNRILQTYLWTREGQLHLTCHYNEGFWERQFVERFLEEWRAVLVKELIG
jgi:hypothetical protein